MYLGLRSGSETWIRRGKCSLGKKGLSDSAVARLDLFVGANHEHRRCKLLGGSRGTLPWKILKYRFSEKAFSAF